MFGLTRHDVCGFGCVWHGVSSLPILSSMLYLFPQCLTFFRIAFEPFCPLFGCSDLACTAAAAHVAASLGGPAGGTPTSGRDAPLPPRPRPRRRLVRRSTLAPPDLLVTPLHPSPRPTPVVGAVPRGAVVDPVSVAEKMGGAASSWKTTGRCPPPTGS